MRAVVQRVRDASVSVNGTVTGSIDFGLLVYLGVQKDDSAEDLAYIVRKVPGLRILPDQAGAMNISLEDVEGAGLLVVSQFTLLGDVRKGRRPSFNLAAPPDVAGAMYKRAVHMWRDQGIEVQTGVFRAHMDVVYVNDGPVTILVDSRDVR